MPKFKMQTYVALYPERPEEFVLAYPDYVAEAGSPELFEAQLAKDCLWYANLGEIACSRRGSSKLRIPIALLQGLMDSWIEKGSPKTVGKGELPQHLRDIESNPPMPCLLLELFRSQSTRYIDINLG